MQRLTRTNASVTDPRPLRVLQFGGGNFLRAFFDWMVEVLNEQTGFNGDVLLVKPTEGGGYQQLQDQQGLFHVTLQNHSGEVTRLVNCIQQIVHPYQDWQKFLNSASLPDCRFVISNTTESGINYLPEEFETGKAPNSFPAKLTIWLFHRFRAFNGDPDSGVFILPTELIEQNGEQLRIYVKQYSNDWDLGSEFLNWLEQNNYFCNTLVDRIVSGFPEEKTARSLQQKVGFDDQQLVVGENYHEWVIQGPEQIQAELPFAETDLNVKFVKDLSPYRDIKVRILNGAHTSLVPVGMLAGLSNVHQVMTDEALGVFINELVYQEIVPTFTDPAMDAEKFADDTVLRFKNPYINHRLESISLNAMDKFQVRLIPTIVLYHKMFNNYPRKIMFCWAALLYAHAGNETDLPDLTAWDLGGLQLDDMIKLLQSDIMNIDSIGVRKALESI